MALTIVNMTPFEMLVAKLAQAKSDMLADLNRSLFSDGSDPPLFTSFYHITPRERIVSRLWQYLRTVWWALRGNSIEDLYDD